MKFSLFRKKQVEKKVDTNNVPFVELITLYLKQRPELSEREKDIILRTLELNNVSLEKNEK